MGFKKNLLRGLSSLIMVWIGLILASGILNIWYNYIMIIIGCILFDVILDWSEKW
jgi:hypothetical protein